MSSWDACTLEPNQYLRWIECHPGLAGYIQAGGIVATLAIALLGPPLALWFHHWRANRDRKSATTSVIRGSKETVDTLLERINGRLETLGTYDEPSGTDWNLFFENLMMEIPGRLDMGYYASDGFEVARLAFLPRLVEAARGYNMALSNKRQDGVKEGEWNVLRNNIQEKLSDLRQNALSAQRTIAKESGQKL